MADRVVPIEGRVQDSRALPRAPHVNDAVEERLRWVVHIEGDALHESAARARVPAHDQAGLEDRAAERGGVNAMAVRILEWRRVVIDA